MNADDVLSGRPPLLRPDGSWDHVALAAWFQDDRSWKVAMPDDDLSYLGPRAGDLLITDDDLAPYVGALVVQTDENMFPIRIGEVDRDSAGRLCLEEGHDLVPIEGDEAELGLVLVVVGHVPLRDGARPTLRDLLRAEALPRKMLPGGLQMDPQDLPF